MKVDSSKTSVSSNKDMFTCKKSVTICVVFVLETSVSNNANNVASSVKTPEKWLLLKCVLASCVYSLAKIAPIFESSSNRLTSYVNFLIQTFLSNPAWQPFLFSAVKLKLLPC